MAAQDLRGDRVERADPAQPLGGRADDRADPIAHLAGGLVGEGDRQQLHGARPAAQDVREVLVNTRVLPVPAPSFSTGPSIALHRLALLGIGREVAGRAGRSQRGEMEMGAVGQGDKTGTYEHAAGERRVATPWSVSSRSADRQRQVTMVACCPRSPEISGKIDQHRSGAARSTWSLMLGRGPARLLLVGGRRGGRVRRAATACSAGSPGRARPRNEPWLRRPRSGPGRSRRRRVQWRRRRRSAKKMHSGSGSCTVDDVLGGNWANFTVRLGA